VEIQPSIRRNLQTHRLSSPPKVEAAPSDYFDAALDESERETYYRGVPQTFEGLHQLLQDTHRVSPDYKATLRLAPLINLQPDGTLHCIFTGKRFAPPGLKMPEYIAELSLKDGLWATRWSQLAAMASFQPLASASAMAVQGPIPRPAPKGSSDPEKDRGTMPAYGFEHAVPQSWYRRQRPMRTDFHILFPADSLANADRGNKPLGQRPEDFLPGQGRGEMARATLYFLVRYPGEVGDHPRGVADRREYTPEDLAQLLAWHREDPPTPAEQRRNQAIFRLQGNRNPFVDFPELAHQIDLSQGFGKPS